MPKRQNQTVAVKVINKQHLPERFHQNFRNEVDILENLNFPGVIGMISVYETLSHVRIVMEKVEGGEEKSWTRSWE